MAHQLEIVNGKAQMFFVGKTPWHGLGTKLESPPTVEGGYWSEHRTVCHPDFQGVGIGNTISEYVASVMVCKGKAYRSVTTHPAMIRHRLRSPLWICTRRPELAPASSSGHHMNATKAAYRMTASFEYIGPRRQEDAKRLGVI